MLWSPKRVLRDAVFAWGSLVVAIPVASLFYAFLVVNQAPEVLQLVLPFGVMIALLLMFLFGNVASVAARDLPGLQGRRLVYGISRLPWRILSATAVILLLAFSLAGNTVPGLASAFNDARWGVITIFLLAFFLGILVALTLISPSRRNW